MVADAIATAGQPTRVGPNFPVSSSGQLPCLQLVQAGPRKGTIRMHKDNRKEPTAPVLDDLLHDGRLARLLWKDGRHCALQLWILQIKAAQSIENRIVYGRLLPYSHSDGHWYSS